MTRRQRTVSAAPGPGQGHWQELPCTAQTAVVLGSSKRPGQQCTVAVHNPLATNSGTLDGRLQGLGEKSYETKTRGTRKVAAARAVGEGTYAILPHGDHTHLAYK